jgi:hypothetical protein
MIRLIILSFILLLSCSEKENGKLERRKVQLGSFQVANRPSSDTLPINLHRSILRWKGTKLMGLGKHEGEIKIQNGFLLRENGKWTGGNFVVSMNTLTVTDIPASDPIPIRNLTNHLKGEDFFAVDRFPVSKFTVTSFQPIEANFYLISGLLEIKGIRKPISFAAESKENLFKANFKIDRFDWNIAYEGSWTDRTLVDRDIEFWVELILQ